MTDNLKHLCRLCAAKIETINNKDLIEENNSGLLKIVLDLMEVDISVNDHLSTKICPMCEDKVLSFQLFILECKRAQELMQKLYVDTLSSSLQVKIEENDCVKQVKSEVKNEFTAEEIASAITSNDYHDYTDAPDSYDNAEFLDEDIITIASLQKLQKKRTIKIKNVAAEDLNETNLSSLNIKNFVSLSCNVCKEEFKNWYQLHVHCAESHDIKPIVFCICGLEIKSKSVLYKHVSEHKVDKNSKGADRSKYINIKDTNLVSFDCNICQEECSSYYSLKSHSVKAHNSLPVIQCKCGALLKSKTVLYKHIADHKNPHVYSCDKCPKITKSLSSMEKHKRRHVPKEERTFKCSSCDRIFNTKDALKSHIKSHIPIEQRKQYECEICNLKFTTRSSASSHRRVVHEKYKGFVCDLCGYACGTGGELRQHRAIHSDDKPFVCNKCPKRFKTYSNLKTHMDTHEDTSYVCYVCSRILNSRRTLKKHLLVHETECRHVCSYCNKAFKRRQTLKVHLSTHTGDKPLSCKWCDERFAYASTLRSHRLRYHPDKMAGGLVHAQYQPGYSDVTRQANDGNLKGDVNGGNLISKVEIGETIIGR
ncbi:hypothetical protein JYU34_003496 [Plutella xylostella]|uniref:Uncharacterized protein n=1 Tax=Plutella xylostella TaxID=51655 RepID=A0ABQ7R070_PLUXY|nr:hypothetical protein JYU34_003496 [Plutella xylostella]